MMPIDRFARSDDSGGWSLFGKSFPCTALRDGIVASRFRGPPTAPTLTSIVIQLLRAPALSAPDPSRVRLGLQLLP